MTCYKTQWGEASQRCAGESILNFNMLLVVFNSMAC